MRSLILAALFGSALPAAAVQFAFPSSDAGIQLVQKLGDETVCGLPSFARRRACHVKFGDFSAWIYFGPDARTAESVSLAYSFGPKDKYGSQRHVRWVSVDTQGRITKAVEQDYSAHAGRFEAPLSDEQARRQLADGLAAFAAQPISAKSERYCSGAGDYEDHMMGCCDGLSEQRVSNDAYKCLPPEGTIQIEPQYPSMPVER